MRGFERESALHRAVDPKVVPHFQDASSVGGVNLTL